MNLIKYSNFHNDKVNDIESIFDDLFINNRSFINNKDDFNPIYDFIEDEKTGSTYFICNNEFYSAPTYSDHSIMKDECMLVSEWENMEDFWESSTNFTHVIRILEKLMERELSKLPDKNHEW